MRADLDGPSEGQTRPPERLPELLELLTFVTAVDERSIRRAARRLHMSPAGIAKRLDNLEAILQERLLVRGRVAWI